ncbi:MAG: hypothetical protein GXO80_12140, partial [Chlorobi bacterium]|nr:hypothetical protein [Chlorobiota bacterium]
MKSQTLSKENFYTYRIKNKATKHFLFLGSDAVKEKRFMRNLTRPKIKKEYAAQVPG